MTDAPPAATASPLPAPRDPKLRRTANAIRALAMDAVEQAKSGHPGMPMGGRDVRARDAGREGIRAALVSMPCWELFEKSPKEYRGAVLGRVPRVAVEAAVWFGWDGWLGPRGAFVGRTGFVASAPGEALFPHFGIIPEKVAEAARSLL